MWWAATIVESVATVVGIAVAVLFFFLDIQGVGPENAPWQGYAIGALSFAGILFIANQVTWGWKLRNLIAGRPRIRLHKRRAVYSAKMYGVKGRSVIGDNPDQRIYMYHLHDIFFTMSHKRLQTVPKPVI